MRHTALCVASDLRQANDIVSELHRAGFTSAEISLISPAASSPTSHPPAPRPSQRLPARLLDGAASGFGHGAMIGAALGWMAGLGAIVLPGQGPALGCGPLMAVLGGAGMGAAVAGIGGALARFGFSEPEALRYEDIVRSGNTLVSVNTDNGYEIETIVDIFHQAGASYCSWSTDAGEVKRESDAPAEVTKADDPRELAIFKRIPRYA